MDLGSYTIKVVSLSNESGGNKLNAYNIKNIPLGDKSANMEKLIKETFDEIDLQASSVNLSVSGPDVIVRFISLPKMNKDQLSSALSFEAEKYIPFNVSDVVLDFLILGNSHEEGQMNVLLAAAKRAPIEKTVKIMEKLSMSVKIVDINPLAMFNAFFRANPIKEEEKEKGFAFLDLGHSQSNVIVSIGDRPLFMRQVQIGGGDVSEALCKNLSISAEKAEEYKRGLLDEGKEAAEQVINSVLDELIKEIQLSFGYFENRNNKAISDIFCSGGMVSRNGLVDYISEGIGIDVHPWNPVADMTFSESISIEDISKIASQLPVSIGLALR